MPDDVFQGFTPTRHPVLKLPETAEAARVLMARLGGPDAFRDWLREREELIKLERIDPYHWGVYPPHWKRADQCYEKSKRLLALGGNRSSKTSYGARRTVEVMDKKPEARVMCLQTTGPNSIALQQRPVHSYLPPEWAATPKGAVTNMKYSRKGGFTENTFIAPNGSQCWFLNYSQDIEVLEGWELDFVWCDELVPWAWVDTLGFRLVTRGGEMLLTFTPIQGYSLVVKQICEGARVTEWRPAELLAGTVNLPQGPAGQMPYVMEPINPQWQVIFFHSIMNAFGNYPELVNECRGKDKGYVMIRAYGFAQKTFGDVFPLLGAHNLVDEVPAEGSNYLIADPAGGRNWFLIWVRVDAFGRHFIYREWPDAARYGEWATLDQDGSHGRAYDGVPGPAQRGLGFGIFEYKREILMQERLPAPVKLSEGEVREFERIIERIMDPRAGRAQTQAEKGGTCLLDRMDEEQYDRQGNVIAAPMTFLPGSGIEIEEKISAINDLLAWDQDKPLEPLLNEPRLYIHRRCRNTIWCLQNWTGRDGQKGASKDPVDCVGMMAAGNLQYVGEGALEATGGGSYG